MDLNATLRRCALILLAGVALSALPATGAAPPGQGGAGLIQPDDLRYAGAFRLPQDAPEPDTGWQYAGHALAYYPDGDPDGSADGYPGSLYGTGHNWHQYVAEISIPAPLISQDYAALPVAQTLQPFTDIRGALFTDFEMPVAGLAYLPPAEDAASGRLYFTWGEHLQEGSTGPSHGWTGLTLDPAASQGLWRIAGQPNYLTNDYLFPLDTGWAAAHLDAMRLGTGRFREGGQGGSGPSLLAIAPWQAGDPPPPGSEIAAITLLRYDDFTGPAAHKLDGYHHSDEWTGGAFLRAGERAAVIFVGTKGLGESWYGFANGVVWPDEPPYPDVPDYPFDSRGFWSSAFAAQFLFYDPADLAAVAAGDLEPWEPQPYASLTVDEVLLGERADWEKWRLGAAAFDAARGHLYVFEPTAHEGADTIVHVWTVE